MTQENVTKPEQEPQKKQVRLHCCQGEAAPELVVEGWKTYRSFSPDARVKFWDLLGPTLLDPTNIWNAQRLEPFCTEHRVSLEDVLAASQSCEFLLRRASALDLPKAAFEEDLSSLSEGDTSAAAPILTRYDFVKAGLRRLIMQGTLADHGKVLTGLSWRVDNVTSSDRGADLASPVVFLTLRYQEGKDSDSVTLQLTPESLQELKAFMERFASR